MGMNNSFCRVNELYIFNPVIGNEICCGCGLCQWGNTGAVVAVVVTPSIVGMVPDDVVVIACDVTDPVVVPSLLSLSLWL